MDDEKLINTLERIAEALEIIAGKKNGTISVTNSSNKQVPVHSNPNNGDIIVKQSFQHNDTNPIFRFLSDRNIQIKTFQVEDENETLDKIALFMGNKYSRIKKVYNSIKSKLNSGMGFWVDLKNATQEEVSYSCQLCNSLYQIAFLSEYKYFKSPQFQIYAKPSRIPTAINFFTGQWLERFIKLEIKNSIRKLGKPVKFEFLTNPQIILPNGDDFELDLLLYLEDEIFWFEAKTGDYQNYVDKYSRMSKIMQIDNQHSFMVLTEVSNQNCVALKQLYGMEVVSIENFSEKFQNAISHLQ